ncbi:MAG: hypothetical protein WD036_08670 [Bauldia sp.]
MVRSFAAILIAVLLLGPAAAQGIADKATQAEALADDGKFIDALATLDEAVTALWDRAPLSFRRGLWVAEPPNGFGVYNPREDSIFAAGDKMIVYAEPVGFGWAKSGDIWHADLIVDLVVKSTGGEVLLGREAFQELEIGSRVKNREFFTTITYTLPGIPAGGYVVETTLRDAVTGKSGTLALPFTIR